MTVTNYATDNNYATLFFAYISRSLAESLATVRAVTAKLPDEERVQACHVLDFGLRTADAWPQARDLTVALAPYVERSGQWETWRQQLQRAILLAEQQQDIASKLQLLVLAARLSQRQGRLAETIAAYRRVIRLARQTSNRYEVARACSNLGYLFIDMGRFGRSGILCRYALASFTALQSNHGLAHTHNHLGLLYTRQKRYVEAEQHLQLACALWERMPDNHSLFYGNVNLGLLQIEMERFNAALHSLTAALQLAEQSGEAVEIARVWNNLGCVHLRLGNFALAASYLEKACGHFVQLAQEVELARIHLNLGITHQQLAQWPEALYHLETALRLFQATQNASTIMQTLIALVVQAANFACAERYTVYIKQLNQLVTQARNHEFELAFQAYMQQYGCSYCSLAYDELRQLLAADRETK